MKTRFLTVLAVTLFFGSCSKSVDSSQNTNPAESYLTTTSGSIWTYHEINSTSGTVNSSDYMVTSTDRDSTINNRKYHIFSYSYGGSQYLGLSGHDYYEFDSIPGSSSIGGAAVERLYLKDNLNTGDIWKQNFTFSVSGFPVPLSVTNKIAEKDISRTVNGIDYQNVIHVNSTISSTLIPASSLKSAIDSYYAPKYGLIENTTIVNLNYMGISQDVNISTQLKSAVLK
ncbi:MAG: hypothetical protein ABI237_13420 [Ginsengibacter sp.]